MGKSISTSKFDSFQEDFLIDTGHHFADNIELYTQYVTARLFQKNNAMILEILNHVANLPKEVAFHMKGN
jgi:hypothetical protein